MTASGELVGRLNAALGRPTAGPMLEWNAAACEYARMRGADIDSGQHEGLWCLNEAARLSGVGLRRVESVLWLKPLGLQFHDSLELMLLAGAYDPEQHYFPNLGVSSVMGGLPGSSHPLAFGRDENGQYAYVDQSTLAHKITTTTEADLDNASAWRIEVKIKAGSLHTTYNRLGSDGNHQFSVRNSDGNLAWFDTNELITSTANLPSWNLGDVYTVAFVATGTQYEFYYSTDDGANWTQIGAGVTPVSYNNHETAATRTIGHTSAGTNYLKSRIYFFRARASASASAPLTSEFVPSMFLPGNRGHGATAADVQGNTWTVTRAGSPLSVIDNGDGNGKRVRFKGTSANYLASPDRSSVELTTADVAQFDFEIEMADYTPGSVTTLYNKYDTTGNQRSWRFDWLASTNVLRLYASSDGTAVASADSSAFPFTDGTKYHVRVTWTVATGFATAYSTDGVNYTTLDSSVAFTTVPFNSTAPVIIGGSSTGTAQSPTVDVFAAAMTKNSTLVSSFDAADIDRHRWRIENTVDSDVTGENWRVVYTDSAEDANDPVVLWHYGDDYAWTNGSTSNNLSAALDAAVADGSVVSVRADVAALDWTPAAVRRCIDGGFILRLDTAGTISYLFDGSATTPSATSSVALPVVDEQRVQIRADHDPTGDTVDFYYRFGTTALTDNTGWTALGAQQSITDEGFDTTITGGTATVRLGGSTAQWDGKLFRGVVIDDGTVVWNVDPSDSDGDGTSFTDSVTSNTVTINRATSGFATAIVKQPAAAFGSSHYIRVPYDAAIDDLPVSYTVAARSHTVAAGFDRWVTNQQDSTQDGWVLQSLGVTAAVYSRIDDGTSIETTGDNGDNITLSSRFTALAAHATNDNEFYTAGTSRESSSAAVGSIAQTGNVTVGARGDGGAGMECGELFAVAVLSKRVTDAEALAIHNELAAS